MADNLPSTQNTDKIQERILKAAREKFNQRKGLYTFFEHGHWWIKVEVQYTERTFDVVDAEGCGTIDGFDFELIDEVEL